MWRGMVSLVLVMAYAAGAWAEHEKSIGVIGDSVATGAVSDETLEASFSSLAWKFATRGARNFKETNGGVDFRDKSFVHFIGTGFGVKPERVYNVAEDGKTIEAIGEQYQNMLKKARTYPDYLIVSFTANDVCHNDVFDTPIERFKESYVRKLIEGNDGRGGLKLLVQEAPKDRNTEIYVLASLNFAQVLTSEDILQHRVPLHTSTVKCERFRAGSHPWSWHVTFLADKLHQMCPAILKTDPRAQDAESVSRRNYLRAVHTAIVEAQEEAVQKSNGWNLNPKAKVVFVRAPSQIQFKGHHVANDCFHLSAQAQGLLGFSAWREIFSLRESRP